MIDEPRVLTVEPRQAEVIRLTIPRASIQPAMGAAIPEFMQVLAAQGVRPYAKGPESSGNPADWQTELYRPLVA